jgi:cobalamin biosynthesis Co2+ chelatase CbiK
VLLLTEFYVYYLQKLDLIRETQIGKFEAAIQPRIKEEKPKQEKKIEAKQPAKASKRKARRTGPQVIVDDHIIIPGNTYETWLNDPSSLVRQRRRVETQKINLIRETKIGEFQASIQEKLG